MSGLVVFGLGPPLAVPLLENLLEQAPVLDLVVLRAWLAHPSMVLRLSLGRKDESAVRVCLEPGCPALQIEPRCPAHRSAREQARGTRQQRGYDAEYDARRKADMNALDNGTVLTCWRCLDVVLPHDYSLGHCDDDRTVIHGPEHLTQCNLANTRGGCPHPSHSTS